MLTRRSHRRLFRLATLAAFGLAVTWTRFLAALPNAASVQGRVPKRFELLWNVPGGCPSLVDVTTEIEELIAGSALAVRTAPVFARASVGQEPGGYALTLTIHDGEAERSRHLGAPTCEELGHAAALIVAIAVDPSILERHVESIQPTQQAEQSVPMAPRYHCRLIDLPGPAEAELHGFATLPMRWRAGIGTFGSAGLLPGYYPGLRLFAGFRRNHLLFEVGLSGLLGRIEDPTAGRGANFDLLRISPRACWLRPVKNLAVGPCGTIELGRVSGLGYGVKTAKGQSALWTANTLGTMVEWRFAPSTLLSATLDLGIPWQRDSFALMGIQVHRPSVIFASLGVNLVAGWR